MPSRLSRALTVILPAIGLLLCTSSALALGIGVTPGKMAFSLRPGDADTQTLHVINQAGQESEFEVYVENGNNDWLVITPGEFTLNALETKSVEITVAPPLMTEPEEYDFSICIVSIPPNSNLGLGAGIKVPTHVQIEELPVMAAQWWIASAIIIAFAAVGLVALWWRKARHA